ncbi:unnamed protein product [Caenorhabditis angaria]|uniref:Translation initiation factor beta propellor-like domain-containing protein n=1 Tax=Caenorhabditis angaria TaxID=860376 RepID=A0A9P1MXI4_9PELO|nr:unnamed protein product [Caenorhabditis angaria]
MGDNLVYAVRASTGVSLKRGLSKDPVTIFNQTSSKEISCNVFAYSNNGQLFAYCDNQITRCFEISTGRQILSVELKRTRKLVFSPKDTHLFVFEPYTIYGKKQEGQKPEDNLSVFSLVDGGKMVAKLKAPNEANWDVQVTDDESLAARIVGSEILIYTNMNFERYEYKFVEKGIQGFSLSPGGAPYHIGVYTPAEGNNPARVKVFRVTPSFPAVANRTFFKSDKAVITWNQKGNALLILASVEVDKTNQSYYGEQSLFLINIQTEESTIVPLAKQGPIYSAKWNPNGKEFAVCYGHMPAKVTFYNPKGIPIFECPDGPRNDIFYNAFGNIILKKEIIAIEVPNTTLFEWAPDGQHFVTCTTAPRLRIDNSYRFWHYTGRMIHEVQYDSPKEELWEVRWRPMSGYNKFEIKELSKTDKMAAGLPIRKKDASHPLNNVPAGAVKAAGAYVPPHLRKSGGPATSGPPRPGQKSAPQNGNSAQAIRPQQTEVERKLMQLRKKVEDIAILKTRVANGDQLQPNQLEKIKKEEEFLAEIQKLTI